MPCLAPRVDQVSAVVNWCVVLRQYVSWTQARESLPHDLNVRVARIFHKGSFTRTHGPQTEHCFVPRRSKTDRWKDQAAALRPLSDARRRVSWKRCHHRVWITVSLQPAQAFIHAMAWPSGMPL
jgi:hypothetical protein